MPDFGTVARRQQGRFRNESLSISPDAKTPTDDKGQRHSHLLALGCEEENLYPSLRGSDGIRLFFRERGIHWWRSTRSGDDTDVDGPTRNLASSQIACVNFLGPLAQSSKILETLLTVLDTDIKTVVPIQYSVQNDHLSSLVEFEWVGLSLTLEGSVPQVRGANVTSVDAMLLADLKGGGRRVYLIEWKYVEEYKAGLYLGDGPSGQTRLRRYRTMYESHSSPFIPEIGIKEWLYEPFYQDMRLLLLGQRMIDEKELGVTDASVVIVVPEENTSYLNRITSPDLENRFSDCNSVYEIVRAGLKEPRRFRVTSQDSLLRAIAYQHELDLADWLTYHYDRYGWGG